MAKEVVLWSARANHSLSKLFAWLKENYGEDYADRYVTGIHGVIARLAKYPTIGMLVRKRGDIRRWKLDKYNYVLYSITDEGIMVKDILPYKNLRKGFS